MEVFPIIENTWLICGGRDYSNKEIFDMAMEDLMRMRGCPSRVIHGAASGADTMAGEFAKRMAIEEIRYPADWSKHGRAAGPIRNQQMIDEGAPSLVIAFPGGKGTADMVRRARAADIDVAEII